MSSENSSNLNFAVKIFSLLGLVLVGYLNQQGKLQASTNPVSQTLETRLQVKPINFMQQSADSLAFVRTSLSTAQRSDKTPALAP